MAALASDWLRHFRLLLWNRWTKFNETWQEARSQRPLPSLCFSGRSEKQDGRPGLWLAETFSTSPLKPLNGIQRILTGSKISTPSTKFVFVGPIGKTRWPPGLWLLRYFRLYLWNSSMEFNATWQESRSKRPLPSLCFSGRSEKQDGRVIFDFSSETAEPNSMTLDRKQDLNALYQFCVFWPIGKTKWPPWPLIGWDIFDFSSETTERNSAKLDRKQALNAFYHVCVFQAYREKTKWPLWPLIDWDIFDFSSETAGSAPGQLWPKHLNAYTGP